MPGKGKNNIITITIFKSHDKAICTSYEGCNFYSYETVEQLCLLFASCPEQDVQACPDCISGQPECDLGGGGEEGEVLY